MNPARKGRGFAAASLLAALFALLGGVGVIAHQRRQAAQELHRTNDEVANLKQEFANLERTTRKRQFESLARTGLASESMPAVEVQAAPEPLAATPEPEMKPETPEEQEAQNDALITERVALLDATYAKEESDLGWANPAAQQLRASYADLELAGMQSSAACRAKICRIDIAYPESVSQNAAQQLLLREAWQGARFCQLDPIRRKGYCYVAREGLDLPAPVALASE